MKTTENQSKDERRMRRAVRKAERRDHKGEPIGGTGATILRLRLSPIGRLIERGEIGSEELRASDEIAATFMRIAGSLMARSLDIDRVRGAGSDSAYREARWAVQEALYRDWATAWSSKAKQEGDPTLSVVIAAAVDERPLHVIAADEGRHVKRIRQCLVAGLRDYAARAGWVAGELRLKWRTA